MPVLLQAVQPQGLKKFEKAMAAWNSLLGRFQRCWKPAAQNAIPANLKVAAFGNAPGFSPPRPPQLSVNTLLCDTLRAENFLNSYSFKCKWKCKFGMISFRNRFGSICLGAANLERHENLHQQRINLDSLSLSPANRTQKSSKASQYSEHFSVKRSGWRSKTEFSFCAFADLIKSSL